MGKCNCAVTVQTSLQSKLNIAKLTGLFWWGFLLWKHQTISMVAQHKTTEITIIIFDICNNFYILNTFSMLIKTYFLSSIHQVDSSTLSSFSVSQLITGSWPFSPTFICWKEHKKHAILYTENCLSEYFPGYSNIFMISWFKPHVHFLYQTMTYGNNIHFTWTLHRAYFHSMQFFNKVKMKVNNLPFCQIRQPHLCLLLGMAYWMVRVSEISWWNQAIWLMHVIPHITPLWKDYEISTY